MLQPIVSAGPWRTVAMDLKGPFSCGEEDERYVLVIQDHFTKYVILVALQNKRATLVSHKVYKHLLCVFGAPEYVITDEGNEFKGAFDELCAEWGIQHTPTLAYHQQANGLVERYMQNLNKLLRILTEERHETWPKALSMHAFAYNVSFHGAIANTPYFLNFGKDPRLPIDNFLSAEAQNEQVRLREFARAKKVDMAESLAWTAERLSESQATMKRQYDAHQKADDVQIGDIVLLKEEGVLPKTAMRWSKPYRVHALDKAGLEVTIAPLLGSGESKRVPLQRCRPYRSSGLNPVGPQLVPAQESTIPPPVGRPTHPAFVESESESEPDFEYATAEAPPPLVCGDSQGSAQPSSGSSAPGDILSRCSPGAAANERTVQDSMGSAFPPAVTLPSVRNSQTGDAQPVADNLLPSPPLEVMSPESGKIQEGVTPSSEVLPTGTGEDHSGVEQHEVPPAMGVPDATEDHSTSEAQRISEFPLVVPPPPGPEPDGSFEVERILKRRFHCGIPFYRVRWTGYGPEADTWETRSQFNGSVVDAYDAAHRPLTRRAARSLRRSSTRTEHNT
jgi:hypothetical protein